MPYITSLLLDNQELLNFISQYLDTQLFLKKIKCLSKYFNNRIKLTYLDLTKATINLCLQNINIEYFSWQLQKFKNKINSLQLFHCMDDSFIKCLFEHYPKITNLNLSYCRNIKNITFLCYFYHLKILNIKGWVFYDLDYPIIDVIMNLYLHHSLEKVILSQDKRKIISEFRIKKCLSTKDILFEFI